MSVEIRRVGGSRACLHISSCRRQSWEKKVRGMLAWQVRTSDNTKLQVEAGTALGRPPGPDFRKRGSSEWRRSPTDWAPS